MITKYLLTIITPALCQFVPQTGMRPDVTFGDYNDRFDITEIAQEQQSYQNILGDYRRNAPSDDRNVKLYESGLNNRIDYAFAYHDDMNSSEGGTIGDFENNLDKFRTKSNRRLLNELVNHLHGTNSPSRRMYHEAVDPKRDILMHYAVPLTMEISGYLQPSDQ